MSNLTNNRIFNVVNPAIIGMSVVVRPFAGVVRGYVCPFVCLTVQ
jgi:hypothetical protein